jgi:membrane fusion protein (multidrug efflux system)
VAAQSQLDNDEAQLKAAITDLAALQAQIERRIVRAPFTGRLGIRAVNKGQYLTPGTTLTTLEAIGEVFVDFTLPQQLLDTVKVGMPVRITTAGSTDRPLEATLSAVDPTLDNMTRSLKLRANVPNEADQLRSGMFVNVEVVLPKKKDVVIVPATAIVHASYGDSVFVIEDKKPGSPGMTKTPTGKTVQTARQQFVRVGQARGDFVAIAEGVTAGQEIVTAGAFKLRNGSPIVVDNSVKLDSKLVPRPENR